MDIRIKNLFSSIEDHRVDRTKYHPFESILYIALCATLAGIESWIGMYDYATEHEEILRKYIDLPSGIPSHDTIGRVISALDVEQFEQCFSEFTQKLADRVKGVIAIDGKTIRGSKTETKKPCHIVSAWSDINRLVLAQVKTDEKSNEITAIPVLLDRLDLQGQIVTLDAMGCQRAICEQIIDKGGDYVISLKGNQGTLNNNVRLWFEDEKNLLTQSWEEWSKGHGRIEHRFCETTDDIGWLQEIHKWPGLKSIAVVHSTRETKKGIEKESRYYISSLSANAEQIARAARSHWGIENSLHWVLDVTMNEDRIQIHNENAPEILSIMRKWGINIINKNKGKYSIKRMIQKMAMSPKNLFKMLLNF